MPFRIINKILDTWDWAKDHFSKNEILPLLGVMASLVFIVIISQCLQYAAGFDDEENSESR